MSFLVKEIKSGKRRDDQNTILRRIANYLSYISYEDLTFAEKSICDLLIVNDYLTINEEENWLPVEPVE